MTFSILGHCPRTGQFGAACTTSSIGIGARVPFLAARTGGECILLGANGPRDTVDGWLRDAAAGGVTGFAIGRSIWWDSLRGLLAGEVSRPEAVAAVAANYRHFAGVFLS